MKSVTFCFVIVLLQFSVFSQNYTSYFTGDLADVNPAAKGGTCMMGGASENDEAMKWFLKQSGGGDILVIRASGSDGYNDYLFSDLGANVNSVETIVFHNAQAASDSYVLQQIQNAEAIWMAGGDQWDYVSYWRNSAVSEIINQNIQDKKMVIGGTSAGMAVLGGIYFTAEFGTISSNTALQNPYDTDLTISRDSFFQIPFLQNVITDTHYDDPDRKGRHITFLARAVSDWGVEARGIACDEYTSVCIDTLGVARIFGDYPAYDENVYFLQVNCYEPAAPEICAANQPLNWVRDNAAVKVFHARGVPDGSTIFNLNTWDSGSGQDSFWENWYVEDGNLRIETAEAIDCTISAAQNILTARVTVFPNPMEDGFLQIKNEEGVIESVEIYDALGGLVFFEKEKFVYQLGRQDLYKFNFSKKAHGIYFVKVISAQGDIVQKVIW